MKPAIALEHVAVELDGLPVLRDVSLELAPGEILAVVGPSGSGKTTALRAITGFVSPTRGSVHVGGRIASTDGRSFIPPAARSLAMVFQELALWPHFTVHGNLGFALESRGVPRAERERLISEMLARVGLADQARRHPDELSGGERQRVAIARALVLEPGAVLLDEPLANLDAHLKRALLGEFRTLFEERGTAALYVSHDLREAATIANRIAVLEGGRIVQQGSLEDLRSRPVTDFVRCLVDDLAWTGPDG